MTCPSREGPRRTRWCPLCPGCPPRLRLEALLPLGLGADGGLAEGGREELRRVLAQARLQLAELRLQLLDAGEQRRRGRGNQGRKARSWRQCSDQACFQTRFHPRYP